MRNEIENMMKEGIEVKQSFISEAKNIQKAVEVIVDCFRSGGKVLICGNGGSAADAQHIAGELVCRFKMNRKGLPAIALTTDSSVLTAWANDINFESVFARQIEALGKKGDVLIAISTSGNSKNVINAINKAKEKEIVVLSLTGNKGGKMKSLSDININVNSNNTPRIQECHELAYHIICELVEKKLFGGKEDEN